MFIKCYDYRLKRMVPVQYKKSSDILRVIAVVKNKIGKDYTDIQDRYIVKYYID